MRLYEIATEFKTLRDIVENDIEFDEQTGEVINNDDIIKELFNSIVLTLGDKLDSSAYVINELEAHSDALKEEAKRLNARAKQWQDNADKLKALMQLALIESEEGKIKTERFTFSLRKSETVEIDSLISPEDFDRKYVRIKREFDKTKIKDALKNGIELSGCSIATKQNLQIK